MEFEGTPAGFGFTLEVEGVEGVIARLGIGEARMGVNGVSVNGRVKLPRARRVTWSLFCALASARRGVGWLEGGCNREPERLPRSVGGVAIERTSVAITRIR